MYLGGDKQTMKHLEILVAVKKTMLDLYIHSCLELCNIDG